MICVPQELCLLPSESTDANYLVPRYVRQVYNKYDKSSVLKVKVVQYTCAAMRAAHLNLVPEL